jgi:phage terminase Nu1 subunit (DNA packaging protein)
MERDFLEKDFATLSPTERVILCRDKADEASKLAKAASPAFRLAYTVIAVEWLILADEIARATIGSM